MKPSQPHSTTFKILLGLMAAGCFCLGTAVQAQDSTASGYANSEENRSPQTAIGRGNPDDGPVRLARFSYVQGNVTWRLDDSAEWSTAALNLPIRQGAQVWVTGGGRAEIQFDDGSLLRLGNNAVATLQTLYSDGEGEFTEIKLTDGLAALRLTNDHSVFQIDTPLISVKSTGPAKLRIGAGDGVEVGVRSGTAAIEGAQGKVTLQSGDYLDLANSDAAYDPHALPREDSWETWNDERDDRLAAAENDSRAHHLPSNIALVATDLDTYGSWHNEPQYGSVWCPRVTVVGWRPYQYGHWTWVNPFGWTWVSDEPWGWAPYHYGTWAHLSYGWAWVPGPVTQCWSPAVVHFTECDNSVAWCPLAPSEVRYGAAFDIGFRAGNASLFFSIGRAAVYYPTSGGFCEPRFFNTTFVNRTIFVRNVTNIYTAPSAINRFQGTSERFAANSNTYLNSRFVPVNSRVASGVTAVNAVDFGGRGRYEPVGVSAAGLFQRGRIVAAPPIGRAPIAGPVVVRPTMQALTPTHAFLPSTQLPSDAVAKRVYRAQLQPSIERASAPIRTVPGSPSAIGTLGGRNPVLPGRGSLSGGPQDPRGRTANGEIGQSGRGTPGSGAESDSGLTPAQIRARDARRSLGMGSGQGSVNNSGGRTGTGASSGTSTGRATDDGRRRDPADSRGTSGGASSGVGRVGGDDGRRRDPSASPGRTGPPVSSGEQRRGDSTPSASRYRTPEQPRNTEPRRTPPADPPKRDSTSDKKDKDSGSGSGGSSSPATGRGRG